MNFKTDKILGIIGILVLLGLVFEGIYIYSHWPRGNVSQPEFLTEDAPAVKRQMEIKQEPPLPLSINLEIPFVSQAPLGDWSYPFDYTCEEAAILMAHYYLDGKIYIDPVQAKKEILEMVDYETLNYGLHEDTNAAQTARLASDYYGHTAKVKYDITFEDIKKELAKGNPVIIPVAGQLLNNPYFKPPGPLYHMLLIKGYNETGFITNEGGTRMGADYVYSYEILENAIHDLENGNLEAITAGRSAMISIEKI